MIVAQFTATYRFPDVEDSLYEEHRALAENMLDKLKNDWDWDTEASRIDASTIHEVHEKVQEILAILKQPKQ